MNNGGFSLNNKTALVTGATGYLGEYMCFALASFGAHVLVNGRDTVAVSSLVKRLAGEGYMASEMIFDVCSDEDIEKAFLKFSGKPIHIIVNNAYSGSLGSQEKNTSEHFMQSYRSSVIACQSVFNSALDCLRRGVEHGGEASVINIASMYGVVSPDLSVYDSASVASPPNYGAAKAGVLQLTRYLAVQYGPENIRVNSLSPGPFPNPSSQINNSDFIGRLADKVPLGRVGRPDELSGPLIFLSSPMSSFVNGCNLKVDGGWTAW